MVSPARHDAIVVGLGAMGSAALRSLAARGVRPLGLDRHEPGHDRGSSHGRSRVIRQAYFEHPDYVPLLRESYERFDRLERDAGTRLLVRTGGLFAGDPGGEVFAGSRRAAEIHGIPHEVLDAAETAAQAREHLGVEAVEAHGDAAQACGLELRGVLGEQHAVGGERDVLDAGDGRQVADEVGEVGAQQRLAAGQPQFAHAEARREPREPHDLGEVEALAGGEEAVAVVEGVLRHAVRAAEVAAVHHRDAQVLQRTAERVLRRRCAAQGDEAMFRAAHHR